MTFTKKFITPFLYNYYTHVESPPVTRSLSRFNYPVVLINNHVVCYSLYVDLFILLSLTMSLHLTFFCYLMTLLDYVIFSCLHISFPTTFQASLEYLYCFIIGVIQLYMCIYYILIFPLTVHIISKKLS